MSGVLGAPDTDKSMRVITIPRVEGSPTKRGYELDNQTEVLSVSKEQKLVWTLSTDGTMLTALSQNYETMYIVKQVIFNRAATSFVRRVMFVLKDLE